MQDWTPDQLKSELDAGKQVFLKLWKKGCGACKLSNPALERIVAADTRGVAFGKINVEDYPQMLDVAETDVLPCFFTFKDKRMKAKLIGFKGLQKLEEFVEQSFAQ